MADRIVRRDGRLFLIRDGDVFVRLRKWWSSDPEHVSPDTRATILDLAGRN